jgi:hypothetical protein
MALHTLDLRPAFTILGSTLGYWLGRGSRRYERSFCCVLPVSHGVRYSTADIDVYKFTYACGDHSSLSICTLATTYFSLEIEYNCECNQAVN